LPPPDGVVGKVLAAKGESLTVDQPIRGVRMTGCTQVKRPSRCSGIQQIAIGGPDKDRLQTLWVDMLGLEVTGTFRSET